MAKPYGRNEIGYVDHPKFLALSAAAFGLWHEGKNYCEKYQTDGLIPKDALRLFRFASAKAIALLTSPCAVPKPDGTAYAPLWEAHPAGFVMHDYLDHNDCRATVLARIEAADERRNREKDRKAEWRDKKRAKDSPDTRVSREMSRGTTGTSDASVPPLSRSTTTTSTTTTTRTPAENAGVTRARDTDLPPMDRWTRDLIALYPPQRRVSWHLVERPLFDVLMADPNVSPWVAWDALKARLARQVMSHEWRVKEMIPRLDRWLSSGAHLQELPEHPVSTLVSDKSVRTLSSAAEFANEATVGKG